MVGTRAVSGPGLKVTLDDAHRTAASLPEGFTADDIVVHQQDVQSVVNALWAGGAEAMMLRTSGSSPPARSAASATP